MTGYCSFNPFSCFGNPLRNLDEQFANYVVLAVQNTNNNGPVKTGYKPLIFANPYGSCAFHPFKVYIFASEVTISKKKSSFVCFYQITNLVNKDVEVKIPTPKHWQQSMPVDLFRYAICSLGRKYRLPQSPSLLVSGSGSRSQRKGL